MNAGRGVPRRRGIAPMAVLAIAALASGVATSEEKSVTRRWTDDEIVSSYHDLATNGGLEAAARAPALPKDPPQSGFLDALAWYVAGTPREAGVLTLPPLDEYIQSSVHSYLALLRAKVEAGESNDYARTRTWKLVQKMSLLREEMARSPHDGRYAFPAIRKTAVAGTDPWELEHTLRSEDEFAQKVCRTSYERPVIVKFGNTNCTQCMLFEIIGSVKAFAESSAHRSSVAVYKVWWGYRPDAGFAGRIPDPARLDALVKAEEVRSSPFFVVYRNGRRYPCGDAFPDDSGHDERLDACLHQKFGEGPPASVCPSERPAAQREDGGLHAVSNLR
jgi:hypothetical protein